MQKPIHVDEVTVEELKEAFEKGVPIIGIESLVSHNSDHMDEFVASLIFTTEGKERFPECAKIGFGNATNKQVEVMNFGLGIFWNMLKNKYLCIGFGGGPLDDHEEENKKECTATLMAKLLKVRNKPSLQALLDYTLYTDKNGDKLLIDPNATAQEKRFADVASKFLPANVIKGFWSSIDHDNTKIEEITEMKKSLLGYLNIVLNTQIVFHEKIANAEIKPVVLHVNGKERVTFVESDIVDADKFARHKTKKNFRKNILTVSANHKTNHFVSLNNPKNKVDIEDYVRVLRALVCQKRDLKPVWEELGQPGTIEKVPELLYLKEQENLLNGSYSHPDVDGLYGKLISQKDIEEAVKLGLGKEFHPDYKSNCVKDICDRNCPLFNMGLSQCREVRRYKGLPKKV